MTPFRSLGVLALAFAGAFAECTQQATSQAITPVGVIAAEVLVRDQPVLVEAIGQTRGARDVEIRARGRIPGEVLFHRGTAGGEQRSAIYYFTRAF